MGIDLKDVDVVCFNVLYRHSAGETEGKHEKSHITQYPDYVSNRGTSECKF
jgi:hypothetical protein